MKFLNVDTKLLGGLQIPKPNTNLSLDGSLYLHISKYCVCVTNIIFEMCNHSSV